MHDTSIKVALQKKHVTRFSGLGKFFSVQSLRLAFPMWTIEEAFHCLYLNLPPKSYLTFKKKWVNSNHEQNVLFWTRKNIYHIKVCILSLITHFQHRVSAFFFAGKMFKDIGLFINRNHWCSLTLGKIMKIMNSISYS